jgi:hypothetical protein
MLAGPSQGSTREKWNHPSYPKIIAVLSNTVLQQFFPCTFSPYFSLLF